MKRIALYARVSTTDQNPEAQLAELRDFAGSRGFSVHREYVDRVSGDFSKRKRGRLTEYAQLMKDAGRRQFDAVVVWKFDRLARSLPALLEALETFHALGIDFIATTQNIDTTTPMGRLFFSIVGAFAEFERALIVDRVRAGLDNARRKGKTLGRPTNKPRHTRIQALRRQGLSLRSIQRQVGGSLSGIQKICRDL